MNSMQYYVVSYYHFGRVQLRFIRAHRANNSATRKLHGVNGVNASRDTETMIQLIGFFLKTLARNSGLLDVNITVIPLSNICTVF